MAQTLEEYLNSLPEDALDIIGSWEELDSVPESWNDQQRINYIQILWKNKADNMWAEASPEEKKAIDTDEGFKALSNAVGSPIKVTELTAKDVKDFPIGEDPMRNPKLRDAQAQWGLATPEEAKQLIGNYYRNYAKQYQAGAPERIDAQRKFYSAIMNSDIPTAQKIYDKYKDDPTFNAYAKDVYKEKPGFLKRLFQRGTEMMAPSAVHRYDEDIKNGTDYTAGDVVKGAVLDGGQFVLGGVGSKAVGALANKVGATTLKGLALEKGIQLGGNATVGAGTEAGREYLNGEELDAGKIGGAAAGQAGTDYLLEKISGGLGYLNAPGAKDVASRTKHMAEKDADYEWRWKNATEVNEIDRGLKNKSELNKGILAEKYVPDANAVYKEAKDRRDILKTEEAQAKQAVKDAEEEAFDKPTLFVDEEGSVKVTRLPTANQARRVSNAVNASKKVTEARKAASKEAQSKDSAVQRALERAEKERKEAAAMSKEDLKSIYATGKNLKGEKVKVTDAMQSRINALKESWTTEANRQTHSAPIRLGLKDVGDRSAYSSRLTSINMNPQSKLLVDDDEIIIESDDDYYDERDKKMFPRRNEGVSLIAVPHK